jgi:lactoylglutathione lyase
VKNELDADANIRQSVPLLCVSKMEQSIRYYVDSLGFEIAHQWIVDGKLRWCWLILGGAALMLQEFRCDGDVEA